MHWMLPGYQPDFCPPGGALVFELRQSKSSQKYLVRAFFTAQTFDQLRNLTPLTLENPPAKMQLLIPVPGGRVSATDSDGRVSATDLDVNFNTFQNILRKAIDQNMCNVSGKRIHPA